jgi:hypothetical protein
MLIMGVLLTKVFMMTILLATKLSFCGVGSHHQNGITEQKIKKLTLGTQTLLLHANQMLPEYISTIHSSAVKIA